MAVKLAVRTVDFFARENARELRAGILSDASGRVRIVVQS